jgi:glutathione synthase
MNGRPIFYHGKYAAFRRVSRQGDIRSNVSAGGSVERADVTDKMLRLVEMVRPKLIQDGMFLVGLDIVEDKLMEINVFSPGGLNNSGQIYKVNFAQAVIEALERKFTYKSYYSNTIDNVEFATL